MGLPREEQAAHASTVPAAAAGSGATVLPGPTHAGKGLLGYTLRQLLGWHAVFECPESNVRQKYPKIFIHIENYVKDLLDFGIRKLCTI